MARRTHVVLIDDRDGSEAVDTVTFGLDGVNYEIDLSRENAERLRAAIGEWTGDARRVGGRTRRAPGTSSPSRNETAAIRAWAREQGMTVSDRGRVSSEVRRAYEEAHG